MCSPTKVEYNVQILCPTQVLLRPTCTAVSMEALVTLSNPSSAVLVFQERKEFHLMEVYGSHTLQLKKQLKQNITCLLTACVVSSKSPEEAAVQRRGAACVISNIMACEK